MGFAVSNKNLTSPKIGEKWDFACGLPMRSRPQSSSTSKPANGGQSRRWWVRLPLASASLGFPRLRSGRQPRRLSLHEPCCLKQKPTLLPKSGRSGISLSGSRCAHARKSAQRQNRRTAGNPVGGGFDSHSLPPKNTSCYSSDRCLTFRAASAALAHSRVGHTIATRATARSHRLP